MDFDVVIAGGGPNGLMLANELRLGGLRPLVLELLPERAQMPKANGLVGTVLKLLDARGLLDRATGRPGPPVPIPQFMFGGLKLNLWPLAENPMTVLPIPQRKFEALLEERGHELGVEIRWGSEVTGFTDHGDHVTVTVNGEQEITAGYLVGCDGGRSTVRKLAGIDFVGVTNERAVSRTANVVLPTVAGRLLDVPGVGRFEPTAFNRTENGMFVWSNLDPEVGLVHTTEWQPALDDDEPMTLDEMRASVVRVLGAEVPMELPQLDRPLLMRRLTSSNTRIAAQFRKGRVFLVGDAAHVFAGVGGPGLNLGLQDAANLAWKLVGAVQGWAPDGLLDTYEIERRPAGERVIMHTQVQSQLLSPGSAVTALRTLFTELLNVPENTQHIVDMMTGADIRYDMGGAPHPLVGGWVPEMTVTADDGAARVAELLRDGKPLLLDLTGGAVVEAAAPWKDRVHLVSGTAAGRTEALLVRPDGFVCWAGATADGLTDALTRWFGTTA